MVDVTSLAHADGWPPPEPISTLLDIPAFALAGVGAAARGARARS
jgi:hypothetical protein